MKINIAPMIFVDRTPRCSNQNACFPSKLWFTISLFIVLVLIQLSNERPETKEEKNDDDDRSTTQKTFHQLSTAANVQKNTSVHEIDLRRR